jgi:hypothetical protein
MTRKDFQLIADVIANVEFRDGGLSTLVDDFANALAQTNAAFDRKRFIAACQSSTKHWTQPTPRLVSKSKA